MRRVEIMTACDREVQALLGECSRPVQKALATLVVGVVLAVSAFVETVRSPADFERVAAGLGSS